MYAEHFLSQQSIGCGAQPPSSVPLRWPATGDRHPVLLTRFSPWWTCTPHSSTFTYLVFPFHLFPFWIASQHLSFYVSLSDRFCDFFHVFVLVPSVTLLKATSQSQEWNAVCAGLTEMHTELREGEGAETRMFTAMSWKRSILSWTTPRDDVELFLSFWEPRPLRILPACSLCQFAEVKGCFVISWLFVTCVLNINTQKTVPWNSWTLTRLPQRANI